MPGPARRVLLLQNLALVLALVQAAKSLVQFCQQRRRLSFQGLAVFRQLEANGRRGKYSVNNSESCFKLKETKRQTGWNEWEVYLCTVLVLLLEKSFSSVSLGRILLQAVQLLLQFPIPADTSNKTQSIVPPLR